MLKEESLSDRSVLEDALCIVLRETYRTSWNLVSTCRSLHKSSLTDNMFDRWFQFVNSRLSETFRCYLLIMARYRYDGGKLNLAQFLHYRNQLFSENELFRFGLYFFDPNELIHSNPDVTRRGLYPNIAPIVSVPYLLNPELLQTDTLRIANILAVHEDSILDDLTECPLFLSNDNLELIVKFISKIADLDIAFNIVHWCIIRNIQPSIVKKLFLLFDYSQARSVRMKITWSFHKEFDCSKLAPYCDEYNAAIDSDLFEYFNLEETLIHCEWFCQDRKSVV